MKGSNSRNRNNRNGESSGLINDDITITSLDNNNSIVLSGTQSEVLRVQGIIQQIDEAPKQVLIEVMILEVSLKNGSVGGVEWNWKKGVPISQEGKTEMGTNFGIRPQYSSGTSNGFVFNFESEYFSAILQSIEDSGEVKIVSAPHILVTNNQKAEIIIGDRVVINKESLEIPTSDNSQPIIRTTRDYVDVGLKLQLTPKIGKNDEVSIDILQEINDIKNSGIPGFPDIAKRSLKTIILVGDQHSAALGGLISKKKTKIQNKVGLLGSLPVIGRLFRKEEVSTQNNELILFITAYVVRSNGDLTKITEGQKKKLQDIRSKILNKK
jgi:general secretion pathway protein D